MIVTTTHAIDGRPVQEYLGIVMGESIVGAHIFRDIFAGIRDIVGGRAKGYEDALRGARQEALREMAVQAQGMGADAVVGVDIDYEVVGQRGSMLMVTSAGTAVKLS
jgi:uncharacterized protein YbjQ (UPF0145 family)